MGPSPTAEARIAVDAMSGDLGPVEVVAAVKLARETLPQLPPITLVGDSSVLEDLLRREQLVPNERLQLLHASEVITMTDKPMQALKRKKDASMVRAIELVKFFSHLLKEELRANPLRATGALLARGAFVSLKERMNPERYGGAPLLGLNGNILKAHGSSNRHAIVSALKAAGEMLHADMNRHIEADIARANQVLATPAAA